MERSQSSSPSWSYGSLKWQVPPWRGKYPPKARVSKSDLSQSESVSRSSSIVRDLYGLSWTQSGLRSTAQVSLAASAAAQVRSRMKSLDDLWQVSRVQFKWTDLRKCEVLQHQTLRLSVGAWAVSSSEPSGKCCCASALQNEVSGILVTSVKSLVRVNCSLQVRGDSIPVGECPSKFPLVMKFTFHLPVSFVFFVSRSRYHEDCGEFEQLQGRFAGFEGEPSLDTSLDNTFQDNFSDVNSEDMRMPVPEWMNQLEMEEDFQYPSPDEYEPSLQANPVGSDYDTSFGPQDASIWEESQETCVQQLHRCWQWPCLVICPALASS